MVRICNVLFLPRTVVTLWLFDEILLSSSVLSQLPGDVCQYVCVPDRFQVCGTQDIYCTCSHVILFSISYSVIRLIVSLQFPLLVAYSMTLNFIRVGSHSALLIIDYSITLYIQRSHFNSSELQACMHVHCILPPQ